jgi:hypothetical protein
MDADGQWMFKFSVGEKLDLIPSFAQKPRLKKKFGLHHGILREAIQVPDVDDGETFLG